MAYSYIKKIIPTSLALVLLIALLLRLWGISYGFPLFLVNDEPSLVLGALKMLQLKTLIPALHSADFQTVLYYPPFASYFYLVALLPVMLVHDAVLGFLGPASYANHIALDPTVIWVAARFYNILMSLAVIALVYHITRRITKSGRAAFLAALFLALSFFHLQVSQVVRHWMPASLMIYAAWYVSLRMREGAPWKNYFLAGTFVGISMGINTSAVIAIVPPVLTHLGQSGVSLTKKIFSARLAVLVITSLVIVSFATLLYPYGFTRGEGAGSVGGDVAMRLGFLHGRSVLGWLGFLGDYVSLLIRYEPTLLAAAILGAVFLMWVRRDALNVFSIVFTSVLYLTALYLFFNEIPRALVFILPSLAVLAGFGLDRTLLWLQSHTHSLSFVVVGLPIIFAVLFFAYPVVLDLRYDYLFAKKDTRLVAIDWVRANIPAGSKILMDSQYMRLPNTKAGIQNIEMIDSASLRSQDRALLETPDSKYPTPAYDVLNLELLNPSVSERTVNDPAHFAAEGYRYFIVEYGYLSQVDLTPQTKNLIKNLPLIAHITPFKKGVTLPTAISASGEITRASVVDFFKLDRLGGFVDIYALPGDIKTYAAVQ